VGTKTNKLNSENFGDKLLSYFAEDVAAYLKVLGC